MNTELLFGLGLIATGAFASGSFAIPFERTRGWAWEHYWMIYSLFAYLVVPALACLLFCPNFVSVLASFPPKTLAWIFGLGMVYGFSNLTFGLSLRYLGLSLGFSLSLGLMMILGTILPPALDGRLALLMQGAGGERLIGGLLVAALGVAVSGYAGYLKDSENSDKGGSELNFRKGLLLVLFVGVTGASQSLAIEQGIDISAAAVQAGINPLFQTLPLFLLIFGGALVVTALWCLSQAKRNGQLRGFAPSTEHRLPIASNYMYCALAGFLWFVNFIFYGMGKSQMGQFSFIAWGILMSLTIVFATLWGFYRGEWKQASKRAKGVMCLGLLILTLASFMVGMSSES